MSTTKHYQIQITGGTSPGPYTVYYGVFPTNPPSSSSIVPKIYPIESPPVYAQNLQLSELTGSGIIVEVPLSTTVLYLYNQFCPDTTITLVPTNNIVYQKLCMTFEARNSNSNPDIIQFIYGGVNPVNDTPYWVDEINGGITIKWVESSTPPYFGNWFLEGYNPEITIISSDSSSANPPIFGWQTVGISPVLITITPSVGTCGQTPTMLKSTPFGQSFTMTYYPVSINQPTCLCDGSILFNPNLDNPPFTYSINNGVTYSDSPIFSNLCSGIYSLSILDSLDNNFTKTITLDEPTFATTYTLSLNTTPSTQINNPTTISKTYETTVIVTPELPDGTTLHFDLVHNNSFYSGPLSGTSILTTGTLLYKNEVSVPLSTTFSGDSTSVNTSPGCQSNTIYQFSTTESWNLLELTNTDIITITTSTRVDKTTLGTCVVGYSNDSYSITNARIVGCDCCSILINT
jgi:hypothetical protein